MKRFPPARFEIDWKPAALDGWGKLVQEARHLEKCAGRGDLFRQVTLQLKQMVRNANFHGLSDLLEKRVAARALTQLWLDSEDFRKRLLNQTLLRALVSRQQPHLGIVPLHNLITLYFREFDRLDQIKPGLRADLEQVIRSQLEARSESIEQSDFRDLLTVLHVEAPWLLSADGPGQLVTRVRDERRELADAFEDLELRGLDTGRYADVCRAHYYLEILRNIPVGQYHEVFDELLQPAVSKAPFQGEKRVGHAALEILIDRTEEDPGEAWQNFIMDLAGDPRIASSASNYREWWKPLGEERIQKVRSWLAREDLRLFLKALEQYGRESGKEDMQRMYPARKRFLEGLDKLKLVRRTRLMLGADAERAVRWILGSDLKTSYVRLTDMPDKAVIYIDCGDFCLLEGSHSFKLWIYLAPPSEKVYGYSVTKLSHTLLTKDVRADYRKKYGPDAPYAEVTHHPTTWQNKVFEFLAENGISLDIEALLGKSEYQRYLARFGMPVVSPYKTVIFGKGRSDYRANPGSHNKKSVDQTPVFRAENGSYISKLALDILIFLHKSGPSSMRRIANSLNKPEDNVADTIYRELAEYCVQDNWSRWGISNAGTHMLRKKGLIW